MKVIFVSLLIPALVGALLVGAVYVIADDEPEAQESPPRAEGQFPCEIWDAQGNLTEVPCE